MRGMLVQTSKSRYGDLDLGGGGAPVIRAEAVGVWNEEGVCDWLELGG